MKNLMLVMASLFAVVTAGAFSVSTNAVATMIVPPVVSGSVVQFAARTATNTVAMGEYRMVAGVLAVAANAGVTMTNMTVTTTVRSGGTYVATNRVSGFVITNTVAAVTNTVTAVADITLPLTGLSAIDGSVYWLRVPAVRNPITVQAHILAPGAVVELSDSAGGSFQVSTDLGYLTFSGTKALYARAESTNGTPATVTVIEQ